MLWCVRQVPSGLLRSLRGFLRQISKNFVLDVSVCKFPDWGKLASKPPKRPRSSPLSPLSNNHLAILIWVISWSDLCRIMFKFENIGDMIRFASPSCPVSFGRNKAPDGGNLFHNWRMKEQIWGGLAGMSGENIRSHCWGIASRRSWWRPTWTCSIRIEFLSTKDRFLFRCLWVRNSRFLVNWAGSWVDRRCLPGFVKSLCS